MKKLISNSCFNDVVLRNSIMQYPEIGANKLYTDSCLVQVMTVNGNSMGFNFEVGDDRPERIIKSLIASITTYLSHRKVSKENEASALILTDINGNFKFAGIVEYHPNTDNPDEPGNWSYVLTFNESDLTDLEKTKTVNKYLFGDDAYKSIEEKVTYDVGGFTYKKDSYSYDSAILIIDSLLQCLDHEAITGQVVEIEMPGYFTASVAVENDEKIFSIVPDGHMKALIKSDISLEN